MQECVGSLWPALANLLSGLLSKLDRRNGGFALNVGCIFVRYSTGSGLVLAMVIIGLDRSDL